MTRTRQRRDDTAEIPVVRGWWGAGSAPHRPNVGSLPSVRSRRLPTRSYFMPGLMVLSGSLQGR